MRAVSPTVSENNVETTVAEAVAANVAQDSDVSRESAYSVACRIAEESTAEMMAAAVYAGHAHKTKYAALMITVSQTARVSPNA